MRRKATLKISGMTCDGCATTIKSFLEEDSGVTRANISYPEKGGEVTYDSTKIRKEDILKNKVFSGTYSVELVKDEAVKR